MVLWYNLSKAGFVLIPILLKDTEMNDRELLEAAAKAAGMRAVQLFIVQRGDSLRFRPAAEIDPGYAETCCLAKSRGVEFLALTCEVSPQGIVLSGRIPVRLGKSS
jgi:sugar fermentation stimulation protein A